MAVRIQFRRDTAANWTSANPTLAVGELGLETDTRRFKIGNGSTAWNALSYGALTGAISDVTGLQAALDGKANTTHTHDASQISYTITDVAGTSYTIQATDEGRVIRTTSGSAVTITLADVLNIGEQITFSQWGAGQITFAPGSVTLQSKDNNRKTTKQYSGATLVKVAANTYWLFGDLAA